MDPTSTTFKLVPWIIKVARWTTGHPKRMLAFLVLGFFLVLGLATYAYIISDKCDELRLLQEKMEKEIQSLKTDTKESIAKCAGAASSCEEKIFSLRKELLEKEGTIIDLKKSCSIPVEGKTP